MKKRVYLLLTQISLLAILCSLVTVAFVFYKGFEKQVFNDLEIIAHLYADLDLETINSISHHTPFGECRCHHGMGKGRARSFGAPTEGFPFDQA